MKPENGVQGLIHRDLKTGNLLLSSGIVKLGDFGISKLLAAHESAAQTMVGTPYYMSPEILQASPLSQSVTVSILSCVLESILHVLPKWRDTCREKRMGQRLMSGHWAASCTSSVH